MTGESPGPSLSWLLRMTGITMHLLFNYHTLFFLVFNRGTLKQQAEQQASLFIISFPNKVWRLIVLSRSRVFCLQRKTLLYLYCFFFHFYYLGLPFVFVPFLFPFYVFFSYKFFAQDFLEMVGSIFLKLSDLIDNDLNLICTFLFWWQHIRSWDFNILAIFRGLTCPELSYSLFQDIFTSHLDEFS